MQTKSIIFLLIGLLAVACKPKSGEQKAEVEEQNIDRGNMQIQQKKWEEVMAVHDEVMPRMSEVNRLTEQLKERMETAPEAEKQELSQAVQQLEAADKGMWDWMYGIKQLGELRDSLAHEGIVEYLNTEEKKIAEVRDQILSSIDNAKALVDDPKME